MTDRPILFSGEMVRALLDGRKSQTRRVLKNRGALPDNRGPHACANDPECWGWENGETGEHIGIVPCTDGSYADLWQGGYAVGDRLYVRESYFQRGNWMPVEGKRTRTGRQKWAFYPTDDQIRFDEPAEFRGGRHHADPDTVTWHKRLARFMPRVKSRLTLLVKDVRVERVQDISTADIRAEGAITEDWEVWREDVQNIAPRGSYIETERDVWRDLWNAINSDRGFGWDKNPWVSAITFEVIKQNIDQIRNCEETP